MLKSHEFADKIYKHIILSIVYMGFMDLEKAYERIYRNAPWHVLRI